MPRIHMATIHHAIVAGIVLLPSLAGQALGQADNGKEYRKLAPGVVKEITPQIEEEETFDGPRELSELVAAAPQLQWQPRLLADSETLLAKAQQVVFRRQIYALEFGFKTIQMIDLEVPQPDGTVRRQKVYYLVYYVRNNGRHLNPTPEEDERGNVTYNSESVDHTIRFFPGFVLQMHDVQRAYLDEVMPAAVARIGQQEDPNRKFYNSVSISSVPIEVSTEYEDKSVWGIVTWTGVDPRSDFFSVLVQGLTNAYRWQDPPGAFRPGDPPMTGRRFRFKTLQVNFWRAGDAIDPRQDEIRYGVPNQNEVPAGKTLDEVLEIYGMKERVDYLWVYR